MPVPVRVFMYYIICSFTSLLFSVKGIHTHTLTLSQKKISYISNAHEADRDIRVFLFCHSVPFSIRIRVFLFLLFVPFFCFGTQDVRQNRLFCDDLYP